MALTPPGANSRQVGEIAKAWRSPTLLSEVIARRKTILNVRFFAVANSRGSKGASDSPSRTTARSQVGTLERVAGLILHAPRRKRTTSWCLPRGPTSKGAWKAAMAATYTLSVDRVRPTEKRSWRNSSTEATWQLTGSNPRSLHHVETHSTSGHTISPWREPWNGVWSRSLQLTSQPLGTEPPQRPDPHFPQLWPRGEYRAPCLRQQVPPQRDLPRLACQEWHDVWEPHPGWPERGYQQ